MPQQGHVEWMGIRPKKREEVLEQHEITVSIDEGIKGDHYSKQGGKRMVTLIQAEHLQVVGEIIGKKVSPLDLRRNIVVSGINLYALQDATFSVGDVILQGTGFMETNLGPGGYNAMRGHGGITAKVIGGGYLKLSDKVIIHKDVNT